MSVSALKPEPNGRPKKTLRPRPRVAIAALLTGAGLAGLLYGLWLIYEPLAFVVGGAALLATGAVLIDIGGERRRT